MVFSSWNTYAVCRNQLIHCLHSEIIPKKTNTCITFTTLIDKFHIIQRNVVLFLKPWVEMQSNIYCDFIVFIDGADMHSYKQQLFFLSWIWEPQEGKLQRENYWLTCRWCWACCAHSHWCCKRSVCPTGPADVLRNCYQTCWLLLQSQMSGGGCQHVLLKAIKTNA